MEIVLCFKDSLSLMYRRQIERALARTRFGATVLFGNHSRASETGRVTVVIPACWKPYRVQYTGSLLNSAPSDSVPWKCSNQDPLAKKQRRILDSCIIAGHTQFYMFFLILLGDDFWKMFVFSIIGSTVNARSCHSLQLFTEYHTFPT